MFSTNDLLPPPVKMLSCLQPRSPLANKWFLYAKNFKGCLFLLAACHLASCLQARFQATYSPVVNAPVQWTISHPYFVSLLSPSHRESLGPGICCLTFQAPSPPWEKSRANKSWTKVGHPRGRMILHWKGGIGKSDSDFPALDGEASRPGGVSSSHRALHGTAMVSEGPTVMETKKDREGGFSNRAHTAAGSTHRRRAAGKQTDPGVLISAGKSRRDGVTWVDLERQRPYPHSTL